MSLEEKFQILKEFVEEISRNNECEQCETCGTIIPNKYSEKAWHVLANITD